MTAKFCFWSIFLSSSFVGTLFSVLLEVVGLPVIIIIMNKKVRKLDANITGAITLYLKSSLFTFMTQKLTQEKASRMDANSLRIAG